MSPDTVTSLAPDSVTRLRSSSTTAVQPLPVVTSSSTGRPTDSQASRASAGLGVGSAVGDRDGLGSLDAVGSDGVLEDDAAVVGSPGLGEPVGSSDPEQPPSARTATRSREPLHRPMFCIGWALLARNDR